MYLPPRKYSLVPQHRMFLSNQVFATNHGYVQKERPPTRVFRGEVLLLSVGQLKTFAHKDIKVGIVVLPAHLAHKMEENFPLIVNGNYIINSRTRYRWPACLA